MTVVPLGYRFAFELQKKRVVKRVKKNYFWIIDIFMKRLIGKDEAVVIASTAGLKVL